MKTLIGMIILALFISACGGNPSGTTVSQDGSSSASVATTQGSSAKENTVDATTASTTEARTGKKPEFKKTATIEETVLIDENGLRVTANELTYTNYAAQIELTIENNTEQDISVMAGTLAYACNSINGYMIEDGYVNCDVIAGKRAKETVSFGFDELLMFGIDEIADIELGLYSTTEDREYTYYPPVTISTSAADTYAYDPDRCRETITSDAMQNAYGYTVLYSSSDTFYENADISIPSATMFRNKDSDFILLLEASNKSDQQFYLETANLFLNGIKVYDSFWSADMVNPGKTALISINLNKVFDQAYWAAFGIEDIENIRLDFMQYDSTGDTRMDQTTLEIPVRSAVASPDKSGQLVYDASGIRLIYKGILNSSSKYDTDLYLLFLAENVSGKSLSLDDVYKSFSLNGLMISPIIYSTELENGECAVWKISLSKRNLEDCDVTGTDDITEIEFKIEIRDDDWNKETGTVRIVFD